MLRARTPTDDDWQQINWLASDEVQEADHSLHGAHWTRKRREFAGEKYESIIVRDEQVVAFCRLEKDPSQEGFRAFVVLDWSACDDEVQSAAIDQLESLVRRSGSPRVWMREFEEDRALIEFMTGNGFRIEKRYTLDGVNFLNLVGSTSGTATPGSIWPREIQKGR